MEHRLIDRIQTDTDGSTVITLIDGTRYRLDPERRQVFRDDLKEELAGIEPERSIISDEPPAPDSSIPPVMLIYRSSASPLLYVLSTPDGDDLDMSEAEAKAILFGR
jgi:hypothetical protein